MLASLMVGSAAAQTLTSGVQATTVSASVPEGVAYDNSGNLYFSSRNDHAVRKVDLFGTVTTVAGTGQQGFAGDGSAATSALLDSPSGIAVDSAGRVYIADSRNHRIRVVSASGIISTVAGTGVAGFSGDGGAATSAQLDLPSGVTVDGAGNLYIADTNNHRIRKVTGTTISTVAGTGEQGFAGDGQAATAALLDTPYSVALDTDAVSFYITDTHNQRVRRVNAAGIISTVAGTGSNLLNPRGVAVNSSGTAYFADSGNEVVRALSSGALSIVAGTGEEGFAGDINTASSALLDTPRAVAAGTNGLVAVADTRNQRVRSVASGQISTVAGVPPPLTEGFLLSGPAAGTFGSAGRLTATFSSPTGASTGTFTLLVNGQAAGTAPVASNTATFDLSSLAGGLQTLAVSYAGDTRNAATVSGVYLVSVAPTTQTISFAQIPTPVTYAPGASVQLTATASSGLPVTFQASGPATVSGSTLTYTGSGTVVVTASQAGNANYAAVRTSQTIAVQPSPLVITTVTPGQVPLSNATTAITVTGSGFTSTSVVRVGGSSIASSVQSTTQIRATLPPVLSAAPLSVTVYDPATGLQSNAFVITTTTPAPSATLTAPATGTSVAQPTLTLTLQNPYPVDLSGVFTLTFAASGNSSVDDTSIKFSNGLRTYPFTVAAGTTTPPPVALQTGTLAGVVTVTLSLTANGQDVTPAAARTVNITIPAEVPTANSATFTQSGPTLTVTLVGFSNTRGVSGATFNFQAAPGSNLGTSSLTLPVTTIFNDWFSSAASATLGSVFTYTQTFNLSDAGTKIQAVTVTLTNSVGSSAPRASQ